MSTLTSYPNEVAWAFLKQVKEDHDYDLTRVMDPADVRAAAQYTARLSPEKQQVMKVIEEAFRQMPPDKKDQLSASAHRLFEEHRGNLAERLSLAPQDELQDTGQVTKVIPIIIGAIFALDAINMSQGAKGSLVGNTFATIGKGSGVQRTVRDEDGNAVYDNATGEALKEPIFGEPDWGSVKEYEGGDFGAQASLVNPFTGENIHVEEDPELWENVALGAASGALSFVNPFHLVGGAARGVSRLASRVAPKTTQMIGGGISRLGRRIGALGRGGDEAAQASRIASDTADVASAKVLQPNMNPHNLKAGPNSLPPGMNRAQAEASQKLGGVKARQSILDQGAALREGELLAGHGEITGKLGYIGNRLDDTGKRISAKHAGRLDEITEAHKKFAKPTGGTGIYGKTNRMAGASGNVAGKLANAAYRIAGANYRAPDGLSAAHIFGDLPFGADPSMPNTSGMDSFGGNPQSQFGGSSAGGQAGGFGQGYGMGDVSNVNSNLGARREIWNPHADYSTTRGQALAGRGHDMGSFGGFGKGFGNMKIGERMLKQAEENMYKAVCPKCGKSNCDCKDYKSKEHKDDKKKPSHGMVIVIGSKAGPGPSTDGKRDKTDSENKEE